MKHFFILFIGLFIINSVGFSQIKKVGLSFNQEEVFVVVDEKLHGINPEIIKLNFDLNKDIYFYKKGYFSQRLEIDPDSPFDKLTIDLIPKDAVAKLENKRLLKPDTLLISKIVTNFTRNDLQEIIDNIFIDNNYVIGKDASLFAGADNEIKNTKYKIGIEIVNSEQKRSVYKAPRFMMAQINIRWSLLDIEQNKVVYFNDTEGAYFVKIQKPKGFIVSEMMERVMKGAIKEAQTKLLIDKKFKALMNNE